MTAPRNEIHEIFPYIRVRDADAAIRYYTEAFGAKERMRLTEPSGRIGHAELAFGQAGVLMLSDEYPEYDLRAPQTPAEGATIHLHVDDADALLQRAVDSGGTLVMAPQDQFYGERSGKVRDPFGHVWYIGHQIEAVPVDEMQRRYDEMLSKS
jgi:PhnB protein